MSQPPPPHPTKATRTRRTKAQNEDDDEKTKTDAAGKAIVDALRAVKAVFTGSSASDPSDMPQ